MSIKTGQMSPPILKMQNMDLTKPEQTDNAQLVVPAGKCSMLSFDDGIRVWIHSDFKGSIEFLKPTEREYTVYC